MASDDRPDWSEIPDRRRPMEPRQSRDAFRKTILVSGASVVGAALAGDVYRWLKDIVVYLWSHVTIGWIP